MTNFQILTSHLGLPMIIAVLYVGWILRAFSQRLGEVTKMKAYYQWYYLGDLFIGLATLGYILYNNAALTRQVTWLLEPTATVLVFHLPLALGVILNLVITLIYWGWLTRGR